MNYLDFFHFDNHPFTNDENINYFYPKKNFLKIIDEITKYCRFKSGIFTITGNSGTGKSIILNKILSSLKNNDFIIYTKADEKTEILKVIAERLNFDSKNISNIVIKLSYIHANGKNVILAIDNAENLSKDELISLNSLIQVLPNLRVILCGQKSLYKKINLSSISPIKKHIIKNYKLKHFSFITAVKYISFMEKDALALSQYKRVISKPSVFLISLIANRNIENLNIIAEKSLINAFVNQKEKVGIKNVFTTIKENINIVKDDIYHKIQKLLFYIILILSTYYTIKIIADRYDLMNHIEAQESIRKQEKELRNA